MTYIITSKCIGVCDTSCVKVCPVDCIHGPLNKTASGAKVEELKQKPDGLKGLQLYIDAETCIDCGACEPECPVDAIFPSPEDVPEEDKASVRKNFEFFGNPIPPGF
jgi:NAD-dependent dihydropyrimidine dehydrogenase PreA subunit